MKDVDPRAWQQAHQQALLLAHLMQSKGVRLPADVRRELDRGNLPGSLALLRDYLKLRPNNSQTEQLQAWLDEVRLIVEELLGNK